MLPFDPWDCGAWIWDFRHIPKALLVEAVAVPQADPTVCAAYLDCIKHSRRRVMQDKAAERGLMCPDDSTKRRLMQASWEPEASFRLDILPPEEHC